MTKLVRETRSRPITMLTATWLLLAACTNAAGGRAAETGMTVEFVLARSGGLCLADSGEAALCQLSIIVRDDGTWQATGTERPAPAEGTVALGAASRLAAVVDDGWEVLTARPFTGTCPTAYDGQEVSYVVRRLPSDPNAAPGDAEVREVRSCTYDLEHPGARSVLQRFEEAWRELGLPR